MSAISCLTLRPNTERPITIQLGTNRLCSLENLEGQVEAVLTGTERTVCRIPLWDGHTADRVVALVKTHSGVNPTIKGTRLTVEYMLNLLARGKAVKDFRSRRELLSIMLFSGQEKRI